MTGYAKVILAATTGIIVAAYSISIKEVQSRATQTAIHRIQSVQTAQIQNAIVATAIRHIAYDTTQSKVLYGSMPMCGTESSYSIEKLSTTSAKITILTSYGTPSKMWVKVEKHDDAVYRNGWKESGRFI
jgi:hypothetical protein